MYNLTINIEIDNYDYLMELQEALNNGLAGISPEKGMVRYSFDCITVRNREETFRGGVASPPPPSTFNIIDEIGNEKLKKYILNEYQRAKRNEDFIEEEEMKL